MKLIKTRHGWINLDKLFVVQLEYNSKKYVEVVVVMEGGEKICIARFKDSKIITVVKAAEKARREMDEFMRKIKESRLIDVR